MRGVLGPETEYGPVALGRHFSADALFSIIKWNKPEALRHSSCGTRECLVYRWHRTVKGTGIGVCGQSVDIKLSVFQAEIYAILACVH